MAILFFSNDAVGIKLQTPNQDNLLNGGLIFLTTSFQKTLLGFCSSIENLFVHVPTQKGGILHFCVYESQSNIVAKVIGRWLNA